MAAVSAGSQKKSNPKSGHEFDLTKYGSVSLQRLVCPGKTEGMSVPPHLCGHTKHYDRKCLKWTSVGATLNAVLLFFSVFIILNLIGPAARLLFQLLKILLRLESPEDAFPAEKSAPAGTRRSVLFPDDEQNEDQDKGRGRGQELA